MNRHSQETIVRIINMLVIQKRSFMKSFMKYFTKAFCATLNERSFSFKKCYVTINLRDFFLIKSHNLQCNLCDFFFARHLLRFRKMALQTQSIYVDWCSSMKNVEILKQSLIVESVLEILIKRRWQTFRKPTDAHSETHTIGESVFSVSM